MSSKRTRQKKPQEEHTFIGLRVERYEASIDASINPHVRSPQYAWGLDDRDPVHKFESCLRITARSIYPEERANETYEVTVYADDAPSRRHTATLADVQVRDKYGSPKYRPYRGKQIPVYSPQKGLGLIDKIRGEPRWRVWLSVPCRFANDMLTLLGHKRMLFIALQERKEGRDRWAWSLSLQTTDPAEE